MKTPTLSVLLLAALSWVPSPAAAQIEAGAGFLVSDAPGVAGTRIGPTVAASVRLSTLGLPVILEAGAGRIDFTSLGQAYHEIHYLLGAATEWSVIRGRTGLALRLGLGAYGAYQTVESDPPSGGGSNWLEAVVPAVTATREINPEVRLVVTVSDALLGPMDAVFDPDEYDIEHRVRVLIGVRF